MAASPSLPVFKVALHNTEFLESFSTSLTHCDQGRDEDRIKAWRLVSQFRNLFHQSQMIDRLCIQGIESHKIMGMFDSLDSLSLFSRALLYASHPGFAAWS